MKKGPSSQIKKLSESFEEALKEIDQSFGFEAETSWSELLDGDPLCILPILMDFLKWKTILIKEALKGNDFSEKLDLDPSKSAIGLFISHFVPPDEVSEALLRQLDQVHKEVYSEASKLAQELRAGALNYDEIKERLEKDLFPLFDELVDLLVKTSDHLETASGSLSLSHSET